MEHLQQEIYEQKTAVIAKDQRKRETGLVLDRERVLVALKMGRVMAVCTAIQMYLMPLNHVRSNS